MSARYALLAALDGRGLEIAGLVAEHRAEVLREVADRLAHRATLYGSSQTVAEVIRDLHRIADEAGKGAPEGEITQPAELTVYRASHESIVMGRYTTREAARKHCETVLRRELGEDVFLGWVPDHGGDDAPEELCIGEDFECSGYVVTPLTVASEYDEEVDE